MAVQVSYPGVYVQEESSGARAIAGVATSIALFVGMAERGRMGVPVRVFSNADFERNFGPTTRGELATQVRQFFNNGGGTAWIGRIANGAVAAEIMLRNQAGGNALLLRARDPGLEGNLIRAEVDFDTGSPEETFNLTVFRSRLKADGTREREALESFKGLSMDPASGSFVDTVVNAGSALVRATASAPAGTAGVSISGLVLPSAEAAVEGVLNGIVTAASRAIRVTLANHPPVTVSLSTMADIPASGTVANIAARWTTEINGVLSANGIGDTVMVNITGNTVGGGGVAGGRLLTIGSAAGPVRVSQAAGGDASVGLMLGVGAGGIEGSGFGDARPAPTGVVARMGLSTNTFDEFREFAGSNRDDLVDFTLTDDSPNPPYTGPVALGGAVPMFEDAGTRSFANARAALDVVAAQIGATAVAGSQPFWSVKRHGIRLALQPRYGGDNTGPGVTLVSSDGGGGGYDLGATAFNPGDADNVAAYTVGQPGGAAGAGPFQTASVPGTDGATPTAPDYAAFYDTVDRDVDLFNLLILPRSEGQNDAQRQALWGPASAFCARKRAFLIVDPYSTWADITQAEAGVDQIRIGIDTRNSACYWPRLRATDGRFIDPSGSIAGLMARTDSNRGVWKAPAGLEANLRAVSGVERRMSDPENGVINPKALNAIRVFPAGVVSWGARTLVGFDGSGNIDDKYVPVRRTMLMIEESLYRGLHFAVFEPNDEPLWAQIRLAAGSFMNGLFRKGAFAGAKASDAYFVNCDASTTTPDDINLGIVNVVVGFAPLKPAEFVVITVRQIAAQAAV
jgi:phage tail sheath protein FI